MTFITQAQQGRKTTWTWYILGFMWVFFAYVLGQIPLAGVVEGRVAAGIISRGAATDFYRTIDFASIGISSAVGLMLLLGSFITALIALYLYVVFVHGRKFSSLVTSMSVRWKKIMFGFVGWFILTMLAEGVLYVRDPDTYHIIFDWEKWLPLMVVVLCILPLQTSFEELFVRGYLLQRIGLSTKRPWIAVIVTSLFFGIMHVTNPEVKEFGLGIMMLYYISVGVFLAVLTLMDDGLEYALGIHAATNVYGAGFVTYKGSALQTDALIKVDVINPVWMLILFYISVTIFIIIVWRKIRLRDYRLLFRGSGAPEPIAEEPVSPS